MDASGTNPARDVSDRKYRESLDRLVAEHIPQLHAYVRVNMGGKLRAKETSLDIVQSVCREALEERGEFVFRGEAEFFAWLATTTLNKLRARARYHGRQRRATDREVELESLSKVYGSLLTASRIAIDREEVQRLELALQSLPEKERQVILLVKIMGLPHDAVAAHIGRTTHATTCLLGRAMTRLVTTIEKSE